MRSVFTPKRLVAGAVAAVVLVGAVAAASARSSSDPSYRTATASLQSVDQVLHTVATVEPVSQASVAFPVAGTVDAVDVSVGEQVNVGSRLASLDVADLTVTLHEKQAALDQAELTLQLALAGEDVGSVSGGSNPGGGTVGRAAGSDQSAALKQAQQDVLDAQHAVDEATAAAQLAFDNATSVCSSDAVDAAVDGSTTTTTAAGTGTAADGSAACLTALQAVLDAQAQVTAAQQDLTEAADALTSLLASMADDPGTTTTTTTPSNGGTGGTGGSGAPSGGTGSSTGSLPSGSNSGTGASGSGTSSPSAEDLIAYQKQVDAAADDVAVAQQAVDQAAIVSPIDGTVASVGLAVGDEVEAASATANVVIVGEGGFEVTTSVSVKDLPDVKVGQPATVTPDGDQDPVDGEVVRIGVAPDSSSSTSSYTVTIALTGDTGAMGNGSTASVVIVTSAAEQALAVPTSAVTVDGDRSTVRLLKDGTATTTTVTTGAIGQTWTEITTGLSKGDEVVLADLDEPLPGSATDTSSSSGTTREFPGGGTFTFPGGTGGPPTGARPGN